jgi:hypothetical protein
LLSINRKQKKAAVALTNVLKPQTDMTEFVDKIQQAAQEL